MVRNITAFIGFIAYVALIVAGAVLATVLVYTLVGGVLGIFGLDIFPSGFFSGE